MSPFTQAILIGVLHLTRSPIPMDQGESSSKDLISTERKRTNATLTVPNVHERVECITEKCRPSLTVPNVDDMNLKYIKYLMGKKKPSLDHQDFYKMSRAEYAAKLLRANIDENKHRDRAECVVAQYWLQYLIKEHKLNIEYSNAPTSSEEILQIFLSKTRRAQEIIDKEIGELFEEKANERPARYKDCGLEKAVIKDFIFEDNRTFGDYFGWEYKDYYLKKREKW